MTAPLGRRECVREHKSACVTRRKYSSNNTLFRPLDESLCLFEYVFIYIYFGKLKRIKNIILQDFQKISPL